MDGKRIIIEVLKHLPGMHRQLNHAGGSLKLPFNKEELEMVREGFSNAWGVWNDKEGFTDTALKSYPYAAMDTFKILQNNEDNSEKVERLKQLGWFIQSRTREGAILVDEIVDRAGEFPAEYKFRILKTSESTIVPEEEQLGGSTIGTWKGYAVGTSPNTGHPIYLTSAIWHQHDMQDGIAMYGYSRINKGPLSVGRDAGQQEFAEEFYGYWDSKKNDFDFNTPMPKQKY